MMLDTCVILKLFLDFNALESQDSYKFASYKRSVRFTKASLLVTGFLLFNAIPCSRSGYQHTGCRQRCSRRAMAAMLDQLILPTAHAISTYAVLTGIFQ